MQTESTVNGARCMSLDEALAGEPPPLTSPFSVLLVGVLRPNTGESEGSHVRLYTADGRDDEYYLIRKSDIDRDRVEPVSPEAAAARGWIANKVVRIRVRASAQLFAVRARAVEARMLSDDYETVAAGICNGTTCAAPYQCRSVAGVHTCVHPTTGQKVPCPTCQV